MIKAGPGVKAKGTKQKNPHPVDNKELLAEIVKSKKRLADNPELKSGAMTPRLAELFLLLVERYSILPNWNGYSYNEEMKADTLLNLCQKWMKFDETKYDNPFAYFTQCSYTSFIGTYAKEKKVQHIRDNVLEHYGMNASYTRQLENEASFLDETPDTNIAVEDSSVVTVDH